MFNNKGVRKTDKEVLERLKEKAPITQRDMDLCDCMHENRIYNVCLDCGASIPFSSPNMGEEKITLNDLQKAIDFEKAGANIRFVNDAELKRLALAILQLNRFAAGYRKFHGKSPSDKLNPTPVYTPQVNPLAGSPYAPGPFGPAFMGMTPMSQPQMQPMGMPIYPCSQSSSQEDPELDPDEGKIDAATNTTPTSKIEGFSSYPSSINADKSTTLDELNQILGRAKSTVTFHSFSREDIEDIITKLGIRSTHYVRFQENDGDPSITKVKFIKKYSKAKKAEPAKFSV